jgi:hypothetical protein
MISLLDTTTDANLFAPLVQVPPRGQTRKRKKRNGK